MSLIKLKNNSLDNLTSFEGTASIGDMKLISSSDISSGTSSVEFDLGDKKEYKFFFVNIHPSTDGAEWQFNLSTDNGSNYNVTKTSTFITTFHAENNSSTVLRYETGRDLAQQTGDQQLAENVGAGSDECAVGYLTLFNPSSTTFVKHYIAQTNSYLTTNFSIGGFIAGYANTTSALTNIKFLMSTGSIDDGKILMFGLD